MDRRVFLKLQLAALAAFGTACASGDDDLDATDEAVGAQRAGVRGGLDVLAERFASNRPERRMAGGIDLTGKRLALVVNHTATTLAGKHAVDVFVEAGLRPVKLFGPEHGVRGEAEAGEKVGNGKDPKTGIPVVSLYGQKTKPSAADLADVDVLFFDIQDIGARFYTYVSTLGLVLEAAAEHGKPVLVLDRPNPVGPRADGNVLEAPTGFVGMWKIPVQHGMTVGELAAAMKAEAWIAQAARLRVDTVKAAGYRRDDPLGPHLLPRRPSPNIRSHQAALLYPGTCLLEGSNVSEGRGTDAPFQTFGAPWITGDLAALADTILAHAAPLVPKGAVKLVPFAGTPTASKYAGRAIRGLRAEVLDPTAFRPVPFGVAILTALNRLYRKDLQWSDAQGAWLRALWGDDGLRDAVQRPAADLPRATADLAAAWAPEIRAFETLRAKHLFPEYA